MYPCHIFSFFCCIFSNLAFVGLLHYFFLDERILSFTTRCTPINSIVIYLVVCVLLAKINSVAIVLHTNIANVACVISLLQLSIVHIWHLNEQPPGYRGSLTRPRPGIIGR
jgi:hypothetical protein